MTEDHSDLNLCPNCGKENLPMATRCVQCGSEMESLFTIFGQTQQPDEETEDSLPEIIEEIRNDPSLQPPAEEKQGSEEAPVDKFDESLLDSDQLPDWLAKVRERAQEEDDAVGDLVSGTIAMDAARSEEAAAGVEGEFNAWINRIREKSQQENSVRARQIPSETEDSGQVPEWLQRIRALRPRPEEETTHEVNTSQPDDLPREWTDEVLQELRRQALAEDHEQETEPLSPADILAEEEEPPREIETEDVIKIVLEEHEPTETDFHNIPEDEEAAIEPVPAEELSQFPEVEDETFVEPAAEEAQQAEETQTPEEEPEFQVEESLQESVEDLPEQDLLPIEQLPEEEPALDEADSKELPEELEEQPEELDQPTDTAAVPPDLLLLRDQQDRASLLASLIEQEGRVTAGKQPIRKSSSRAGRLVVALLLLVGLIASILIGPASMPTATPKSIPALALDDQIQTLAESDKVLVVLDYQAATSRELESLAAPIIEQINSRGIKLTFLTIQPSGLYLAQSLLAQAGLPEETQVEYLPGSYLSLISQSVNPAILVGKENSTKDLRSFKLVLLVSDSAENVRGWLEQIAPWMDSLNFAAVTTQMEAPVLSPYFDSGQLVGYAAGITDGNIGTHAAFNYRAYRVGLLLMLVMLLLGMISKGEEDAIRREEERAE